MLPDLECPISPTAHTQNLHSPGLGVGTGLCGAAGPGSFGAKGQKPKDLEGDDGMGRPRTGVRDRLTLRLSSSLFCHLSHQVMGWEQANTARQQ